MSLKLKIVAEEVKDEPFPCPISCRYFEKSWAPRQNQSLPQLLQ